MAPVTWIGFGQLGWPTVTDLWAAGRTAPGMEIASDVEFAQLVGGVR
ncbi:hypothetical protein [Modestobacter marinus]|nr:hypothetical protein [Modestobacter marinus]